MEHNMKNTMENAKALAGAVHDIAHATAYPMVTEVIKTQVQLAERVSELEDDMESAEGNMQNLMQMTTTAMESIRQEMHEAAAELSNPDDERLAKLEQRTDRLEEQMTQIIHLLGQVGQLD